MIPVTLHYANMTTYPLERIVTKSLSPITDKTYHALTQGKVEENTFQGQSLIRRDGELVLAVLPTKVDLEQLASESTRQIIVTKKNGVLLPLKARNSVLTLEASSSRSPTSQQLKQ